MRNDPISEVHSEMVPATGEQLQLWHYQYDFQTERPLQVLMLEFYLEQPDIGLLKKAIEILIRRHEGLRTYFTETGGSILQCVAPYDEDLFQASSYDIRGEKDIHQSVARILDANRLFLKNLEAPPLLRSCLFRVSADNYYVCLLVHHIISDEWSVSLISKELSALYEALRAGEPVDASPHPMQSRDYAIWQKEWWEHNGSKGRAYWAGKLRSFERGLFFERLSGRYIDSCDDGALLTLLTSAPAGTFTHVVQEPLYDRLIRLASQCKCGILTVMNASLKLLIYLLTDRKKTVLAMPVAARSWPGAQSILGYLVGGVYLYQEAGRESSILDFIKEGFLDLLESNRYLIYNHAEMELDETALRLNSDVFVNFISREMIGDKGLEPVMQTGHVIEKDPAYYALSFYLSEYRDGLKCTWKYNTALYTPEIMTGVIEKHIRLLSAICERPGMTIGDLVDAPDMMSTGFDPIAQDACYEVSGEQTECWRYHNSIEDGHPHEVLTTDAVVGDLDGRSMEKAIEVVIRRHESLRTFFRIMDGKLKQCVLPYDSQVFATTYVDVSGFLEKEKMLKEIETVMATMRDSVRNMQVAPLLRTCIVKLPDNSYYLYIVIHHIISDEGSMSIIHKELSELYGSLKDGKPVDMLPAALQLRHYASWQRRWLADRVDSLREYWTHKLQMTNDRPGPGLPAAEWHALLDNTNAASYACCTDAEKYDRLVRLSGRCKGSVAAVMTAAVQILFYSLGQKKILIAMPISSRPLLGAESLIGYCVGKAYIHRAVDPDMPIEEFIKGSHLDLVESAMNLIYDHDRLELDGLSLRLYCNVFMNFLNKKITGNTKRPMEDNNSHRTLDKPQYYALHYNILEFEDRLSYSWEYNPAMYTGETISRMEQQHAAILDAICENPGMTINGLMTCLFRP